jgi:cellulose synthase/poly-beta-1,6-N-acetylglucosamine synthase-like glycosyltransferase
MKFIIRTIIIVVAAHFSLLYFPWWSMAICAFFAGAIIAGKNLSTFFSGFIGLGFLWLIQSFIIHNDSSGLLSNKIAELFSLSDGVYMVIISGIVAGLVGGFSTLSGFRFRRLFSRDKSRSLYR